jgi:NADH:ubiquinone oxidoreductase subunit F (NADH-binding)
MTVTAIGTSARVLGAAAPDLAAHRQRNGALPRPGAGQLIRLAEQSGLTGRGGAGFPTWRKLAAVATGPPGVVVANGAEGEPASAKDRTLLSRAPHLVLDGLQLAAEAVRADRAYIYTRDAAVGAALAERRAAGWDHTRVEVVVAPDGFVTGEETAVVAAIEGRAARPRDKARRIVESGVRGRPTLVQNVETLAHLALIARHGSAWFRARGTVDEPGTFLASVGGAVAVPGVYEIGYGLPVGDLLRTAGGASERVRAILIGGYHGTWLPAGLDHLPLSRAGLRPVGGSPGAGVVLALPATRCGLVASARIIGYLAAQNAGQCGPCVNGLPRLADTFARLARRDRHPGLSAEVTRLAAVVEGRGACRHPDGTVRLVRSSLEVFGDEVARHLTGRCEVTG